MCFVVERVGADLCFVEEEKSLQTVLLCKECVNSFVFCCTKKGVRTVLCFVVEKVGNRCCKLLLPLPLAPTC